METKAFGQQRHLEELRWSRDAALLRLTDPSPADSEAAVDSAFEEADLLPPGPRRDLNSGDLGLLCPNSFL